MGLIIVPMHKLASSYDFNKTEATVFSCRLCFLGAFPFISLIYISKATQYVFFMFLFHIHNVEQLYITGYKLNKKNHI